MTKPQSRSKKFVICKLAVVCPVTAIVSIRSNSSLTKPTWLELKNKEPLKNCLQLVEVGFEGEVKLRLYQSCDYHVT